MTWQEGTAAGYLALLEDLKQVMTNSRVDSLAVTAGGSGYAVGDVLAIDGGTTVGGHTAAAEVLTVSTGAVSTVRIYRGGAYTVNPGTSATTTGETNVDTGASVTGTGCTITTTIASADWSVLRESQEAASATIGAGGTGYSVSDKLTLVGGLIGEGGTATIFNVDTVSGGVVTAVSVDTAGNYEEEPTPNPIATTGGGGSGCTLNVTWQDATTQERVLILNGTGLSGTDDIYVGIKAYELTVGFDTAWNFCLLGFTGFNSGLTIEEQPGISPGLLTSVGNEGETDDGNGAFVPLKDSSGDDISWYANVNGRRIVFSCAVDDGVQFNHFQGYLGFLDQVGTNDEYAYPLCVASGVSGDDALYNESSVLLGGIVEPIPTQSTAIDPAGAFLVRHPDGSWIAHAAALSNSASVRTSETEFGVFPLASLTIPNTSEPDAMVANTGFGMKDVVPTSGVPGTASFVLKPSPGTADEYLRRPVIPFRQETPITGNDYYLTGELGGVFWFARGGSSIVALDRLTDGDDRYRIFTNGNRTQDWSYFCIAED